MIRLPAGVFEYAQRKPRASGDDPLKIMDWVPLPSVNPARAGMIHWAASGGSPASA